MKRRSRAGGEPIKGRRGKSPEPKRRNAPKASATFNASSAVEETKVARLTHELKEALEQQSATSEVLRVISGYPGDPQPVFQAMLKNAVHLCDAEFGNIYRWDGGALHLVATQNAPPAFAEARRLTRGRPGPKTPTGRMIANKRVVHIADLRAEKAYADRDPWIVTGVELGGVRRVLMVPMLKENELIGAFSVYRQKVQPFSDKQIELSKNFAAQAVIAIENARLLNELRQRTTDLSEALEQQTATSEVLRIISASPGALETVFEAILKNATRICEAAFGSMLLRDGDTYRRVALHNAPVKFSEFSSKAPILKHGIAPSVDRVIETKKVVHILDQANEEPETPIAKFGGARTILNAPLLKENEAIGVIGIYRQEVRPFAEKQIALLTNFAAQAVIAIENARLLNELRGALERQTATSEVLQVISTSPGDLKPVFAAMLEKAVRICDAKFGNIYRAEGDGLRNVVTHNTPTAFADALRGSPYFSPAPNNPVRRMMTTKKIVHVLDVAATEAYAEREPIAVASVELGKTGTLMIVPMLKDNELVGAFTLARQEVRPFSEKQIDLVANFAAQAVIAIENARLLNELRHRTSELTQSLEQQTAISDVLQIISSSLGDLKPVFEVMLQNAIRICAGRFGILWLYEGEISAAQHFTTLRPRLPNSFKDNP